MNEKVNTNQKPLFHKDFLLVVIGQIISLFGNAILRFALPLYILNESGSPALFGMVSASSFLPMVIMSPLGGIVADRVNKQRIMVVLDFLTAVLITGFTILSAQSFMIPLVVITMMILYSIQGAYTPAVQASIPLLAVERNLMPANAVVNLVNSLSSLMGPVIGGILFGKLGLRPILIISAVCFLFSAILELFIRIPHQKRPAEAGILSIVRKDMVESFRFMTHEFPVMVKVVGIVFSINLFLSSMIMIGLPVIVTKYLGLSSELYGINQGGLAVGGLLGGVLTGVLSKKLNTKDAWKLLLWCSLMIFPMGIVLFADLPALVSFWVITILATAMMVCTTIFSIQMLAFVQGNTPVELVGKVIACVMALSIAAQPVGQALFGLLFEKLEAYPGVIVLGAGFISAGISLFSKSAFRQLTDIPAGEVCEA